MRLLQGPHEVVVVLLWIQHLRFEITVLVMRLRWVFGTRARFPPLNGLRPRGVSPANCATPGEAQIRSFTRGHVGHEAKHSQRAWVRHACVNVTLERAAGAFQSLEVPSTLTRRSTYGYVVWSDLGILLTRCKVIVIDIGSMRLSDMC